MKQIPDLKYLLEDFYWRIDSEISPNKNIKFCRDDFDINLFSQTWGSTALGFCGFGGMAITEAYTTVILYTPLDIYAVYFDGDFAYYVLNPNEQFYHDLMEHKMTSIHDHAKYEKKSGIHKDGLGWNARGVFCGECLRDTCEGCQYEYKTWDGLSKETIDRIKKEVEDD